MTKGGKATVMIHGRNAARAAATARRGHMTAAGLAILMTGLEEIASIQLPIAAKRHSEYAQLRAYATGAVAEPGEAIVAAAADWRITVDEMAQRWRSQAAELAKDAEHAQSIHGGYVLTSYSVLGRHAYFCSDEMTAVVRSAARSALQPNTSFTEFDLPSPHGIAYLSDGDNPVVLRWCTTEQTVTTNLATMDGLARLLEEGAKPALEEHLPQPYEHIVLSRERSDESPTIEVRQVFIEDYRAITSNEAAATLVAFSRLIQQERTVDQTPEPVRSRTVDRRGRKRTQVDQITYVTVHRNVRTDNPGPDSGRSYSHRWVVRGHWRRQWYPSQERHIPIWITDHIAGPDDKPIMHRDRVTILRKQAADSESDAPGGGDIEERSD